VGRLHGTSNRTSKKSVILQFRVTPSEAQDIRDEAKERGMTVSQLVRRAMGLLPEGQLTLFD
jgi:hypothetical protein